MLSYKYNLSQLGYLATTLTDMGVVETVTPLGIDLNAFLESDFEQEVAVDIAEKTDANDVSNDFNYILLDLDEDFMPSTDDISPVAIETGQEEVVETIEVEKEEEEEEEVTDTLEEIREDVAQEEVVVPKTPLLAAEDTVEVDNQSPPLVESKLDKPTPKAKLKAEALHDKNTVVGEKVAPKHTIANEPIHGQSTLTQSITEGIESNNVEQNTTQSLTKDTYTKMSVMEVWPHVQKFMLANGVTKAPVPVELLENEFGAITITKLIKKSYLLLRKNGCTMSK